MAGKPAGRPKIPVADRKAKLLSLRLNAEQIEFLDEMAERIKASPEGFSVSRSAVAVKLIELGRPALEKLFPAAVKRKKSK